MTDATRYALFVRLEAKAGKEAKVEEFLRGGLALVQQEPATTLWFGVRLGPSTFGIFDTFPDEAGRTGTPDWGSCQAVDGERFRTVIRAAQHCESRDPRSEGAGERPKSSINAGV